MLMEPTGMLDLTLLTISSDDQLLRLLQWHLGHCEAGPSRMAVAATIEDACLSLEKADPPRLIVLHWGRGARYEGLNRLLWTTTVLAHRVPVLVVSESYRVEQATRLYRMGVTEYISRTHHEHQIGRVLDTYLRRGSYRGPAANVPADQQPRRSKAQSRASLAM